MATADMQLIEVVRDLQNKTSAGEIQWSKINPTTYSWSGSGGRIVMQKIVQSPRTQAIALSGPRYHLEVLDSHGDAQVSLVSGRSPEAASALQALYVAITSAVTAKGVDFFRQLVGVASTDREGDEFGR